MATGSINISSNISKNTLLVNYPPKACAGLNTKPGNGQIKIWWSDPDDFITSDGINVTWKFTRLIRKTGSFPIDETDGTIVVDSSVKNQYTSANPFIDTNLTNGVKYYYRLFACSDANAFNHERIEIVASPVPHRIMTVKINLNNSNPATCGSYADDAIGMPSGKTADAVNDWKQFFGYKPCLFKNGKVVGYLNPNDYSKFEDGSSADITSGNAGDVMIEFPRRGIKISVSSNTLTVSMTDEQNDPNFKYYAHQRGTTSKKYFYIGAYLAPYNLDCRSISGKYPANYTTLNDLYHSAVKLGSGYGILAFHQWVFIQTMYILQFHGNLNSQSALGYGMSGGGRDYANTGRSNDKGLCYGDTTVAKLFGIEDIYGNLNQWVNNIITTDGGCITSTTDDTNDDPYSTPYDIIGGNGPIGVNSIYYTHCIGTPESGFISSQRVSEQGSSSTYFCDGFSMQQTCIACVGGDMNGGDYNGIFTMHLLGGRNGSSYGVSSRLQYL